jgi:hypothetical protein
MAAYPRRSGTFRAARYDRGSKQRLGRIRMRSHSSLAFWIFVIGILIILFIAVPWFATQSPRPQHHAE